MLSPKYHRIPAKKIVRDCLGSSSSVPARLVRAPPREHFISVSGQIWAVALTLTKGSLVSPACARQDEIAGVDGLVNLAEL
jgi:hypothetical protein